MAGILENKLRRLIAEDAANSGSGIPGVAGAFPTCPLAQFQIIPPRAELRISQPIRHSEPFPGSVQRHDDTFTIKQGNMRGKSVEYWWLISRRFHIAMCKAIGLPLGAIRSWKRSDGSNSHVIAPAVRRTWPHSDRRPSAFLLRPELRAVPHPGPRSSSVSAGCREASAGGKRDPGQHPPSASCPDVSRRYRLGGRIAFLALLHRQLHATKPVVLPSAGMKARQTSPPTSRTSAPGAMASNRSSLPVASAPPRMTRKAEPVVECEGAAENSAGKPRLGAAFTRQLCSAKGRCADPLRVAER